ncbi:DUF2235 domain-containing protein [Aliterella atlantica]|uniref:T6SS Phospholipase effector Tle1-like catalytic domain-containing protein n=1 Tax=Aliterella atlantica CENA595 TaxID=1618023 RepID=A0A0D8ZP77_9CYAN|nr:DUF2235 domain-containing protein [Aliterella atlantica]KJH70274.1 hypothetical protein UH38_19205 [Aliterella atlantica CENA595]
MKRLVVCCDGTWQKLSSSYPTNVVKIAQAVKPVCNDGTPQIAFYDEGLGAGDELDKLVGGAFGWGIDQNIQDAYRFLCLNYNEGDEIYLFGFSRGAYTVRSLAGMIYCSGLLSRPNIRSAPEAYRIYRDRDIKPSHPEAQGFRAACGERVPITLLGCWDTVGSLGVPDQIPLLPVDDWFNAKYKFHDTTLSSIVQKALHAVAIDELRKVFDVTPMQKSPKFDAQVVRQVWFPGEHGCVGGGTKEQRGLSDAALQWMMNEIGNLGLGLEFEPNNVEDGIQTDPTINFDNQPGFIYQVTGTEPREITGSFGDLHESVKTRWQARVDYRPENLWNFRDELSANS